MPRLIRFGRRDHDKHRERPQRINGLQSKKRKTTCFDNLRVESVKVGHGAPSEPIDEGEVESPFEEGNSLSQINDQHLITPSRDMEIIDSTDLLSSGIDATVNITATSSLITPDDAAPRAILNTLFSRTALYRVAKPLIDSLEKMLTVLIKSSNNDLSSCGNKWGQERIDQLINHVISRVRNVFGVVADESTGAIDKKMVDSAITYISTLQSGGTNFSQNEYVKNHILEALVINDESIRSVAARLGVNRKFLPSIVDKRKEYDKLCVEKRFANSEGLLNQDDQTLESTSESFIMGMGPDELGKQHLFAGLHIDPEDDFFFNNAPEGEKKRF
jgi:hypothetical protein